MGRKRWPLAAAAARGALAMASIAVGASLGQGETTGLGMRGIVWANAVGLAILAGFSLLWSP